MTSSISKEKTGFSTKDIVYIGIFTALIAVCSWICIPTAVPFTMQTFAIFLAVGLLGGKRGSLAVIVYVILGAIGLPVFSEFTGGFGILLGTTGGYIVGFVLSALIVWLFEGLLGRKTWVLALSMVLGMLSCYALGTAWFILVYSKANGAVGILTTLSWCVFPFVIPDLIKIALALLLSKRLYRYINL